MVSLWQEGGWVASMALILTTILSWVWMRLWVVFSSVGVGHAWQPWTIFLPVGAGVTAAGITYCALSHAAWRRGLLLLLLVPLLVVNLAAQQFAARFAGQLEGWQALLMAAPLPVPVLAYLMAVAAPIWPAMLSLLPCRTVGPLVTKLAVSMGVAGWLLLAYTSQPVGLQLSAYCMLAACLWLVMALGSDNKMLWVLANAGPPALKPVLQQDAAVAAIVLSPAEVQELITWLNSGLWKLAVGAAVFAIVGAGAAVYHYLPQLKQAITGR